MSEEWRIQWLCRFAYEHRFTDAFWNFHEGPMCRLWVEFLDMVQLLLVLFIQAILPIRIFISTASNLLAYIFAYANINYIQYVAKYIGQNWQSAHFRVQISDKNTFGKTPENQCIAETINMSGKISCGIVRKSTNQATVSRWDETAADQLKSHNTFARWLVYMNQKIAPWLTRKAVNLGWNRWRWCQESIGNCPNYVQLINSIWKIDFHILSVIL